MTVLLSYDLLATGDRAAKLSTATGLAEAVADLRFFVRAAKHTATVMVFLGESLNRGDAGFLCPDSGQASLACQFGEDVDAFADAIEALCAVVRTDGGMACTVPLANIPLFPAVEQERYGASHTSRGIVDWFEQIASRAPSMDVFSADLTPSNTSGTLGFDINWDVLGTLPVTLKGSRPFVVASYGADAFNTTHWYNHAGTNFGPDYPVRNPPPGGVANTGTYVLNRPDGHTDGAEDEASQAAWVMAFATELESHFVGCGDPSARAPVSGIACSTVASAVGSGGVLRSFRDEWWRAQLAAEYIWYGSYASFCDTNPTCVAMKQLCPSDVPPDPRNQSACGAPFNNLLPDDYLNEEWFGLLAATPGCACASSYGHNASACTAADYYPRARQAFFDQALWRGPTFAAGAKTQAASLISAALATAAVDPLACPAPSPPACVPWNGTGAALTPQAAPRRGQVTRAAARLRSVHHAWHRILACSVWRRPRLRRAVGRLHHGTRSAGRPASAPHTCRRRLSPVLSRP